MLATHCLTLKDWTRSTRLILSTIDLCLSVFPWASFRSTKAAIKLHTLLDLRGSIPSLIYISDGKMHDVKVLDLLQPEPAAFYVMDRGYLDFERLARLDDAGSFFVTRAKSNTQVRRRYSRPVDRSTGLVCDQTVVLTGYYTRKGFNSPLRRVKLNDPETGKTLVFLSNIFVLPAMTIAKLYKIPPEGGAVLQMDQAAPADQGILRRNRKRRQNPNLVRRVRLRAGRHRQKAPCHQGQPLSNAVQFSEPYPLRENPAFEPVCGHRPAKILIPLRITN